MIGIDIKKMGLNTEFCSDVNGSKEFKCQCKDGFIGKRCEVADSTLIILFAETVFECTIRAYDMLQIILIIRANSIIV